MLRAMQESAFLEGVEGVSHHPDEDHRPRETASDLLPVLGFILPTSPCQSCCAAFPLTESFRDGEESSPKHEGLDPQ